MRLDSAFDDDAAPSPHVQQTAKTHALADIDIDNCAAAPASAAAAQGQRLLKQMQEKGAGEGRVVAKVLMTRAVPVVKQASASFVFFCICFTLLFAVVVPLCADWACDVLMREQVLSMEDYLRRKQEQQQQQQQLL